MNNVNVLRAEKGITQARLAELCDVSQAAISRIESDDLTPSLPLAQALAKALECTISDLFPPPS